MFYSVVMLFLFGYFGLLMWNKNWATLGYFSGLIDAITSAKFCNPRYTEYLRQCV